MASRWPTAFVLIVCFFAGASADTLGREVRKVVAGEHYRSLGAHHDVILGEDYRALWLTPIEVEVLDLKTFAGGLRPVMRVGGLQTRGLAMKGGNGRSYTFRSIDKDPAGLVHEVLRGTPVQDLIQDQIAASHPASSLIAPVLEDAVGILGVRPRMVVMPEDASLGEFLSEFGGVLGTISEFPTPGAGKQPGFHGAREILNTSEMWERFKSGEKVDSEAFLRARLLDILMGDWDRHQGQWKWARLPNADRWQPIAEDRDQAFSNYEDLAAAIGRTLVTPQLIRFRQEFPRIDGITFNAWPLDRLILPELEWAAWEDATSWVQSRCTDEVIQRALRRMPGEYFEIVGQEMERKLIDRREILLRIARKFYLHLAAEIDIHAGEQEEMVRITRLEASTTPKGNRAPCSMRSSRQVWASSVKSESRHDLPMIVARTERSLRPAFIPLLKPRTSFPSGMSVVPTGP